jgi:hypothetical protein
MLEPPYETKTGLVLTKDGCGAWSQRMPAGWNVRVTTFDSEGKPRIVRNFLAYEADEERAVELVRKRVPVNEGELAEAAAEVTENQFVGPGMRPGDVRRHHITAGPDEE